MMAVFTENLWPLLLITLWILPWKGVALWRAARNGDKGWFVVILVLNTLAILDIIYIFAFSGSKNKNSNLENMDENASGDQKDGG